MIYIYIHIYIYTHTHIYIYIHSPIIIHSSNTPMTFPYEFPHVPNCQLQIDPSWASRSPLDLAQGAARDLLKARRPRSKARSKELWKIPGEARGRGSQEMGMSSWKYAKTGKEWQRWEKLRLRTGWVSKILLHVLHVVRFSSQQMGRFSRSKPLDMYLSKEGRGNSNVMLEGVKP